MKTANKKLINCNQYIALEKSCKELSNSIALVGRASAACTKKKPWNQCTLQYQRKRIQQVAQKVQTALSFTSNEHLKSTKLELTNEQTGDTVSIDSDGQMVKVAEQNSSKPSTNQSIVDQTSYVKERIYLSNEAYHEMAMVNTRMPRLNVLLKTANT